jgi:hypothetical protein
MLKAWLESEIQRVREERGPVAAPEDTFALVRSLQSFWEVMAEYSRVISGVVKVAKQEQEEELKTAVGDQDGVPNGSLTVPDTDGTAIKLTLSAPNVHTIDVEPLRAALAWEILATTDVTEQVMETAMAAVMELDDRAKALEDLESTMMRAITLALARQEELGKFEPQVSKVRALAKTLASAGFDNVAATVTRSITTKKDYKGITPSRETPK